MYDEGSLAVFQLSGTAAVAATANGAGVDITSLIGTALVLLDAAAGTGTTPTDTIKLQDSPDNVTFTDVPNAVFTQLTTVASSQKISVNVDGMQRYVRVVDTVGGTTPSFTRSVNMIGRKQVLP